MQDENKLFTNLLVYGFLIFVGVQTIRMIHNVFIAHQENQSLIYSKKVASTNKASIKNSSYISPSQNYRNPYKECSYSKANYEVIKNSKTSLRYCIDLKTKEITSVNNNEETRVLGKVGEEIFQRNPFFGQDIYEVWEYSIENYQLIRYKCSYRNGSCNGKSQRDNVGYKRF